jgi:hypothetical protein
MNANVRIALPLFIALAFAGVAAAQTAPGADPGAPPPPRVQSAGGVEYINGGAGEESRQQIVALSAGFLLRIVFSVTGGAYVVADHVDVASAGGKVLALDGAGPLLAVKVAPGDYFIDVIAGGKSERRPIHVGTQPVTLNWRLPDEAKR